MKMMECIVVHIVYGTSWIIHRSVWGYAKTLGVALMEVCSRLYIERRFLHKGTVMRFQAGTQFA